MKVVVAVIIDSQQQVLITQRALHLSHGGFWEFPGGKVEENENPIAALKREIKEEVGLEVLECVFLGEVQHTYQDKPVELLIYRVLVYTGKASCCEDQMDLRWVSLSSLYQFKFPAANQAIISMLCA